jgi:prophage regulatory protein
MAQEVRKGGIVMPGILGESEVEQLTNLSRTTLWRLERQGRFPQRLRLSGNRVGWRSDEVLAWIEALPRGFSG